MGVLLWHGLVYISSGLIYNSDSNSEANVKILNDFVSLHPSHMIIYSYIWIMDPMVI